MTKNDQASRAYAMMKEIAILNQLATAEFNRTLPDGLHVSHFTIIEHLANRAEGQTPQDLARVFQMSKQTMTHSVAQLQKRGFVSVGANPRDGRSKIVMLTQAGRAFRDKAVGALAPLLVEISQHEAFAHLDDALPAMQSLRSFLDERRN